MLSSAKILLLRLGPSQVIILCSFFSQIIMLRLYTPVPVSPLHMLARGSWEFSSKAKPVFVKTYIQKNFPIQEKFGKYFEIAKQ